MDAARSTREGEAPAELVRVELRRSGGLGIGVEGLVASSTTRRAVAYGAPQERRPPEKASVYRLVRQRGAEEKVAAEGLEPPTRGL